MPAICAVIPAYNAEHTIRQALESVIVQTAGCTEIMVVDDASTDATVAVARETLGTSGFRFQVSSLPENAGPAVARNRGIAEARSEWIAFLDGDDVWMPWKLAHQLRILDAHPGTGMVCGPVRTFGSDDELAAALALPAPQRPAATEIGLTDFVENNPVATSTVLVRRDVLEDAGGFDPQFRGPEDFDLWLRTAARTRIVMADAVVSLYRRVPGSLSMDERRFLPEVLRVLDKAFGHGGALAGHPELRQTARATQLWNASWMAFHRGDRGAAVRLWLSALRANLSSRQRVARPWIRLLARYALGKPSEKM
jgi:hypothetical protein